MTPFADMDNGQKAQAASDVKALLESPGWAVLQGELADYVGVHLKQTLGAPTDSAATYAFQAGRIRAAKLDLPELVKQIITGGENAAREMNEETE